MFSRSPRSRWLGAAASVLVAATWSACNSNPTPTSVPRAIITVNSDPNPIPAVASQRVGTTFSARYKVVITENAGQGCEVQAVNSTLYDEVSGVIVGIVNYDTADLLVFVGQKRIEANGTMEVPIQIDYFIPNDVTAKAARLNVLVNVKDDHDNLVSSSALVRVQ